jgi:hypothetical protein
MREPKFKVGQIVVMQSMKKQLPFRILDKMQVGDEWHYAWNKKNYAAEHMLRELTENEKGGVILKFISHRLGRTNMP